MADHDHRFGWQKDPVQVDRVLGILRRPLFRPAAHSIRGSGEGKISLLYENVREVVGYYPVRNQTVGDCVSQGAAAAVDAVKATEIVRKYKQGSWIAETATEPIYGLSRVEVGGGQLSGDDGSFGAWGALAVKEYGTLLRMEYGGYDLTTYSGDLARKWGESGLPDELEPVAAEHPIRTVSLVLTYEDVRDALANGYACTIASDRGFKDVRDEDGFLKPKGSWPHQMAVVGVDDKSNRPGVCVINSWGKDWVSGPKRHNQPDGSFWVDAGVLENDILSEQDSWAFGDYVGWPRKKLDLRIV